MSSNLKDVLHDLDVTQSLHGNVYKVMNYEGPLNINAMASVSMQNTLKMQIRELHFYLRTPFY